MIEMHGEAAKDRLVYHTPHCGGRPPRQSLRAKQVKVISFETTGEAQEHKVHRQGNVVFGSSVHGGLQSPKITQKASPRPRPYRRVRQMESSDLHALFAQEAAKSEETKTLAEVTNKLDLSPIHVWSKEQAKQMSGSKQVTMEALNDGARLMTWAQAA